MLQMTDLEIGTIKAEELHVEVFVADEVRISPATEFWGKSYFVIEEGFWLTAPGDLYVIKFEDSDTSWAERGDWLQCRTYDYEAGEMVYNIWFSVSNFLWDDRPDVYKYILKHESGGSPDLYIKEGSVMINYGRPGSTTEGFIELTSLEDFSPSHVRFGDLSGKT